MGDSGSAATLLDAVTAAGSAAGLGRIGVASPAPLESARAAIEDRLAHGFDAGMQFTFRNPARSTDPQRALPSVRAIVVGLLPYPAGAGAAEPATASGRVAWYAATDHYARLGQALEAMAAVLRSAGWRAVPVADSNALVDRAVAERAGIGWFGKNANLLASGLGSWFVIGSVLTDAPLPVHDGGPADQRTGCGTCRRCLPACPTGAIVAPGVIDARRCLAWLVQADGDLEPWVRVALGDRIYGCDDCQEACPPNQRLTLGAADTPPGRFVDLVELLDATDDELLARHGRWYVPRRDPAVLRRNALVALGNVGDPTDGATVDVLERHLRWTDALVRRHAVWACRRLGLDEVLDRFLAERGEDPDAGVRAELVRPVEVIA